MGPLGAPMGSKRAMSLNFVTTGGIVKNIKGLTAHLLFCSHVSNPFHGLRYRMVWPGSRKVWPGSIEVLPGSRKVLPRGLKVWPGSLKCKPIAEFL